MLASSGPRNISEAEAQLKAKGMKFAGTFIAQPDGKRKYEGLLPLGMLKQLGLNPAQYMPLAEDKSLLLSGKQVNSYVGLPEEVFNLAYASLVTEGTIPSGEAGRTIKLMSIPGQWYEDDLGTFDINTLPIAAPSQQISDSCYLAAKKLYDSFLVKLRPLMAGTSVDNAHFTHAIHRPSMLISVLELEAKKGKPNRVAELSELVESTNTAIKSATEAMGYTATNFYMKYARCNRCMACA